MKVFSTVSILVSVLGFIAFGCVETHTESVPVIPASETDPDTFGDYWFQGEAEISSYELSQSRYGEQRDGHAVLVFVTEAFSKSKHVKLDRPNEAGSDRVDIMKLNFIKKFNTGIYPYSMMQSVFTPLKLNEFPHSLKTTASIQEWCGHVFNQFNLRGDKYQVELRSYFESEGDVNKELDNAILEDELWNRIRINPESLPTGKFEVIPALFASRLRHTDLNVTTANASLEKGAEETSYTISYPEDDRKITIRFQTEFPHKILGWEETYTNFSGKEVTTSATLKETIKGPYWQQNGTEHNYLREELGLSD